MPEETTPQIKNHLTANAFMKRKDIIINNFLGGVSWGVGTVIGATLVAAIIIGILRSVGVFSVIPQYFPDPTEVKQEIQNSEK